MAVNGLELFRDRFRQFAGQYVLIGGTACFLAMDKVGVQFRATKDLDIVLMIEAIDQPLAIALWEFIREGGYDIRETSPGPRHFYRFAKPTALGFPFMLELFSRAGDALELAPGQHIVPAIRTVDPAGEPLSLSAILLDNAYYTWIQSGRIDNDGLPYLRAEHLIPLKARAWLDLTKRRQEGEPVDSRNIKKHRNDIFQLLRITDPDYAVTIPASIQTDIGLFCDGMAHDQVDLKALGYRAPTDFAATVTALRSAYIKEF